jgi:D-xylose transport system permease protein
MQATLDKRKLATGELNPLLTYLMLGLGIAGLAVAALILLGWLPLGVRANVLRSDRNWIEYTVIMLSVLYGIACLRTWSGLNTKEQASIAWTQWVSFITIFIGLALIASVVIPGFAKVFLIAPPETLSPELLVFYGGLLLSFVGVLGIVYQLSLRVGVIEMRFREDKKISMRAVAIIIFLGILIPWLVVRSSVLGFILWAFGTILILALVYYLLMSISGYGSLVLRGSYSLILLGLLIAIPANLLWVTQFPNAVQNVRNPEPIRLLPGIVLFLAAFWAYRQVGQEEQSDELRRAVSLTPGKLLRVQLAKSPSAGAIIGFVAIFLAFTMATDLFLRPTSIGSILTNISSQGVIAIGVTILMISGEFDLSVGSILGVVAMLFMVFMTEGAPFIGVLDPLRAAFLAVAIGMIMGFINGFILVTTGIPSFIVTLGTMLAYRAIALVGIAGGRILRYRDYFNDFPQTYLSSWFIVALVIIGILILLYSAWRTLPVLWGRFQENWKRRNENGDFGTTTAIASGIFALLITVVFVIAGLWLALVTIDNFGGEITQVGFFDLVNGRWDGQMLLGTDGIAFGGAQLFNFNLPSDANFRMAIVWWFILVLFFHTILTSTAYGNSVFAVGGNVGAARAQGINVAYVKVFNFVLLAALTGVAAVYETARNPGVDPLKGAGWELDVIAMTVIGGALLTGGYGSIIGSLLGTLIFGMLQTGLVLVGIESRLFSGTVGIVIIIAVVLNTAVRGRRQ